MGITVYVLRSLENAKRYVGLTNDLSRRLLEHKSGNTKAGQLLRRFELLHTETYPDYAAARQREEFLKSGRGREWLAETYGTGPASGG
jgi:putative endonuclease